MKKAIIITSVFIAAFAFIIGASGFCNKDKAVSKEINLSISSNADYSMAVYHNNKVSVHVVVTKLSGDKQTVVLDKSYDNMQLQDIPTNGNAINKKMVIPNVFNQKEKLIVVYTISYESDGSILQYSSGQEASDKKNLEQIEINI